MTLWLAHKWSRTEVGKLAGRVSLPIVSISVCIYVVNRRPVFQIATVSIYSQRGLSSIQHDLTYVSWLVTCSFVFADPLGRLCLLVVTIKDKPLRLNGVSAPNHHAQRQYFFRWIEPINIMSLRIIFRVPLECCLWLIYRLYKGKIVY